MMSGWMSAWMFLWFIFLVLLIALMIAALVWLVRNLAHPRHDVKDTNRSASDELDLAYARGQLSRGEYLERRADLDGVPAQRTAER